MRVKIRAKILLSAQLTMCPQLKPMFIISLQQYGQI